MNSNELTKKQAQLKLNLVDLKNVQCKLESALLKIDVIKNSIRDIIPADNFEVVEDLIQSELAELEGKICDAEKNYYTSLRDTKGGSNGKY